MLESHPRSATREMDGSRADFPRSTSTPAWRVCLLLVPGERMAAQNTATVTGRVTDANSLIPLSGVEIQLSTGAGINGVTNNEGRFVLLNVPVGDDRPHGVADRPPYR